MEKIKEKYNIIHRWLIVLLVLSFCLFIFLPSLYPSVICLIAILTCAGFVLKSLLSLNCLLHRRLPIKTFLLGSFIAVGGSTFDIVNTIIQTPDLSFEANPIARLFLDNNFSVLFVYVIGALGQTLVVLFTLLLWTLFLKTYPLLLSELQNKPFKSLICTLLGGPKASYVDLLVGKIEPIYTITAVAPVLIGSFFYRWYLGLEWLELVPISRVLVPSLAVVFSLIGYLYFMRKKLSLPMSESDYAPLSVAEEDGR